MDTPSVIVFIISCQDSIFDFLLKDKSFFWERKTVLRNKDCLCMFVFVLKPLTKSLNPDIKIFCCNSLFFSDFAQKQ